MVMSRPVTISASSRRLAGSRLEDGSSRTRISGSMASTVATATRRRWPKLTGGGAGGRRGPPCPPRPGRPSPGRPARRPRRPRLAGPKATSSRTVGMNSWSSGSWKTIPTRRRISLRCSVATGRPATATCRPRQEDAVEVQHQRGLARPVGAEQGHPLAPARSEVDPEQRLVPVGVGVGDAVDLEGGGGRASSGGRPQAVAATSGGGGRQGQGGQPLAAASRPGPASTGIGPA